MAATTVVIKKHQYLSHRKEKASYNQNSEKSGSKCIMF